jgi:hypothetical protein
MSDDPWATYVDPAASAQAQGHADPWAKFVETTAPPLDKYQQAAADKLSKLREAGVNPNYGPAESFISGRMLGALPTVMGALTTPASMIEHGTLNPIEGYNYAKAQQNANTALLAADPDKFRELVQNRDVLK